MSTEVERLVARLEVQQRQFERQMQRAQQTTNRSARGIERRFQRTNRTVTAQFAAMGRQVRGILGTFGVGLGGAAITRGIRQSVSDLADIGQTARDVSLDVEELQGLMRGFERDSRVSADAAAQAFERFNRRIGEAANGSGEFASMADRYNIRLRRANGELRTQSELIREVADAIRRADSDQERAAIAQAAFGDVGRQMVDALRGGAQGLDEMIRRAVEAGETIESDLIDRAEELDRRFDELTTRMGVFFKQWSLEAADFVTDAERMADAVRLMGGPFASAMDIGIFVEDMLRARDAVEELFGSMERAESILGEGLVSRLMGDAGAFEAAEAQLHGMNRAMEHFSLQAESSSEAIQSTTRELIQMGEVDTARYLGSVSEEMRALVDRFRAGEIDADTFAERMRELETDAREVVAGLGDVDGANFDNVIAQFGNLIAAAEVATRIVASLREEVASATGGAVGGDPAAARHSQRSAAVEQRRADDARDAFLDAQSEQAARTRDQIALDRERQSVERAAREEGVELTESQIDAQARLNLELQEAARGGSGGGSGGSGGGSSGGADAFSRMVESMRQRSEALQIEAEALIEAAVSGREYGEAMAVAQARAQLLNAAQREGIAITPELREGIDELAESYAQAGLAAREAANDLRQAEDNARRGAQAVSNLFGALMSESRNATEALARLLAQMAQIQLQRALLGLADSGSDGGLLGFLGGLLGMSGGGYTGDGGKHEPKGIVHGGEYVFSKSAVQSIGVDNLERAHRSARGFANGGLVGNVLSGGRGGASTVDVRVWMDRDGHWRSEVARISEGVSRREYDRREPRTVSRAVGAAVDLNQEKAVFR